MPNGSEQSSRSLVVGVLHSTAEKCQAEFGISFRVEIREAALERQKGFVEAGHLGSAGWRDFLFDNPVFA